MYSEKRSQLDAMKECQKDDGYLFQLTSKAKAKHDDVNGFVASMSSKFHGLQIRFTLYLNIQQTHQQILQSTVGMV